MWMEHQTSQSPRLGVKPSDLHTVKNLQCDIPIGPGVEEQKAAEEEIKV